CILFHLAIDEPGRIRTKGASHLPRLFDHHLLLYPYVRAGAVQYEGSAHPPTRPSSSKAGCGRPQEYLALLQHRRSPAVKEHRIQLVQNQRGPPMRHGAKYCYRSRNPPVPNVWVEVTQTTTRGSGVKPYVTASAHKRVSG